VIKSSKRNNDKSGYKWQFLAIYNCLFVCSDMINGNLIDATSYETLLDVQIGKMGGKPLYRYVSARTIDQDTSQYSFTVPFDCDRIVHMSGKLYRIIGSSTRQHFFVPCVIDNNSRYLLYASGTSVTIEAVDATFRRATIYILYQ
jgi:hypothetical protein